MNNNYDYIIVGASLKSYLIAYKLLKLNYKCKIVEKKNKFCYFDNFKIIKTDLLFSSNDVNFLNFLNELNINFKEVGIKYDLQFKFKENLSYDELTLLINEFLKVSMNNFTCKEINFMEYLRNHNFLIKSIDYLNNFCNIFDKDINTLNLYDFITLLNCYLFCDYYILDYTKLITQLQNNINNLEIEYGTEYEMEIINVSSNTKYIYCISSKNLEKIHQPYDIKKDFFINIKTLENIKTKDLEYLTISNYLSDQISIVFTSNTNEIDKKFDKFKSYHIYNYDKIINNIIFDNVIILKNNKKIEDTIINSLQILNNIDKNIQFYKNDNLTDIIKLSFGVYCLQLVFNMQGVC